MCHEAVEEYPCQLHHVSDQFKTKGMCEKVVRRVPYTLDYVLDQYKTQEMCDDAVRRKPWLLEYVPDWFATKQQIKSCYGHEKRRTQKAKIKEELMHVA